MWDEGAFVLWIFKGIVSFYTMIITGIVDMCSGLSRRSKIKQIEQRNVEKRNVVELGEPQSVSAITDKITTTGKIIISGNASNQTMDNWSNEITARCAKRMNEAGLGVVILHRNSLDLKERLQYYIEPEKLIFLDDTNKRYDPVYGAANVEDCLNILTERDVLGTREMSLSSAAYTYLEALVYMSLYCLKRTPWIHLLKVLAGYDYASFEKTVDKQMDLGKITTVQHDRILDYLKNGMTGRDEVRQHLNSLEYALSEILFDEKKIISKKPESIKSAFIDGKVIVLSVDLVSKRKVGYGLMVNDLMSALHKGTNGYLVSHDLEITGCDSFKELLGNGNSRLGICIASSDLFSQCSSIESVFNSVTKNKECMIILRHTAGPSALAVQKEIGVYKKKERTEAIGEGKIRMKPTQLFRGNSSNVTITFQEKDEPRVPSHQIQEMVEGEAYIIEGRDAAVVHCSLSDA